MSVFNVLRHKLASMASAGAIGPAEKSIVRPLLVSGPVKPKRPVDVGSKMRFDEYSVSRYARDKVLRGVVTGKQEQLFLDNGHYAPIAFAAHKENEQVALKARVLPQKLPAPDLPACVAWIRAHRDELFPRVHRIRPVEFSEYIRRVGSAPAVKKALIDARDRLEKSGWRPEHSLTRDQVRRYVQRSSFAKVENLLYETPKGVKSKAPRLIQGAQAEFVAIVGPCVMALQDLVCRRWRPGKSNLVFTSGVSAEAAAEHITSFPGATGFDDVATFDLDQTRPWGELMVSLCRAWHFPTSAIQLMEANIDTIGKTHGGFRYSCRDTRKSGDPYTSLFNTIINICAHLWIFCTHTGMTIAQAAEHFRMLAQGDDNCFVHTSGISIPWRARMLLLGFDSEATYAQLTLIEFCSMRLYRCAGGEWTFGPKPGRVINKFGYAINRPPNITPEQYLRGVALSQLRAGSFIPPLRVFLERVLALTAHVKDSEAYCPRHYNEHQLRIRREHVAGGDVYMALHENYYWCYGKQRAFEEFLSTCTFGDVMPAFFQMVLFDKDTDGERILYS